MNTILTRGKKILEYWAGHRRLPIALLLYLLVLSHISGQVCPEPPVGMMAGQPEDDGSQPGKGLLFYLSGKSGFHADLAAGGQTLPNFNHGVSLISDGALGNGFRAGDDQLLSYWAPGNIYAQRGTLAFFWRSGYPVGPTPFPIFRVSYADHSSWDMVWLRIDYNGSGFDAFVTDVGLARTRVSWFPDTLPGPDEWIHLALSWDETEGIRFYLNGEMVASNETGPTVFDSGLDQFGPHSRIISPYQVQSAYSFMRGGDLDEIRIYDRMLPDETIARLAMGSAPEAMPVMKRDLDERRWRDAWWLRHGWNLPNPPPPELPSGHTLIRKVEIHEAVDIKRWYWKANDGIRETTWPGVYNMSRLPGRYDYFVLPDWDCYSGSGQSVRFTLPDEQWNHVEVWGRAWGQLTLESKENRDFTFAVRTPRQVKSYHRLPEPLTGGRIRFDNALIEEPIGSLETYFVAEGKAPEGIGTEQFLLSCSPEVSQLPVFEPVASFIRGRYPADERSIMVGIPASENRRPVMCPAPENAMPFLHILVPCGEIPEAGLDGIEIRLPPMRVTPTHGELFPMNIRVKDPRWFMRDLADFSFSVRPGDSPVLFIDTRDRILKPGCALYLTIAGAGPGLTPALLEGARITLVYKPGEKARIEHEADRLTQIRDLFAHMVEEHPESPRLNLYNRFMADCRDLLSVNPDHWLAQTYMYAVTGKDRPAFNLPECPEGIPEWAFYQVEYLRYLERLVNYYIDKRQVVNGEFGGGLSDDGDLTNMWPVIAFLGIHPEKILKSLQKHMEAYYDQERPPDLAPLRQRSLPLMTNGLATIFTDELHALEDGIQVVGQLQLLDPGNPVYVERAMETARRLLHDITQINSAGHRHFRTRYYGATRMATEDPWQWSVNRSYLVLQSAYLLAWYNGNPDVCRMITQLADGLLAHRKNGILYTEINFETDQERESRGAFTGGKPWSLFVAAQALTGEQKYLDPLPGKEIRCNGFDREALANRYREEITRLGLREYIDTEGSIWIDRISSLNPVIQEDRLGGRALTRTRDLYPQHRVSWKFTSPSRFDDVAIFLSESTPSEIKIVGYNLSLQKADAIMTAWNVTPGKWSMKQDFDYNGEQLTGGDDPGRIIYLERGTEIPLTFEPRVYSIISLRLLEASDKKYDELPDLAMGPGDVQWEENTVTARIHNIGSTGSPGTRLELRDGHGNLVATGKVPPLEAPVDLVPRWTEIILRVKEGTDLSRGSLQVDPDGELREITRTNSWISW